MEHLVGIGGGKREERVLLFAPLQCTLCGQRLSTVQQLKLAMQFVFNYLPHCSNVAKSASSCFLQRFAEAFILPPPPHYTLLSSKIKMDKDLNPQHALTVVVIVTVVVPDIDEDDDKRQVYHLASQSSRHALSPDQIKGARLRLQTLALESDSDSDSDSNSDSDFEAGIVDSLAGLDGCGR